MNILVLGGSGQLGQCLRKVATDKGLDQIVFASSREANISDLEDLMLVFESKKPNWVVNCAAYTAVDKAEEDVEACRAINHLGAKNVSQACSRYGAKLVHISTDFVFKGTQAKLWREDDPTEPVNIYGETKLAGEKEIALALREHFIIRTSWLYSEFSGNFVKTMLRLANGRTELNVIADQVGTPTYAIDLAEAVLAMIASGSTNYGIYHFSNEGVASWYDFAVAIFEISGTPIRVNPIPTKQYPTPAERPKFSVMNKSKFKTVFGMQISHWRESLGNCLLEIRQLS